MKRKDADTLGYRVLAEERCPAKNIDQIVRGVLLRARIKPVDNLDTPDLWLLVNLQCIKHDPTNYVYFLGVKFAVTDTRAVMTYLSPYDVYGIEDEAAIQRAIRDQVERAVTDYLEAQTKFPAVQ